MIYLFGGTGRLGSKIEGEVTRVSSSIRIEYPINMSIPQHSVILNCAAFTDVCAAEREPKTCFNTNVNGVFNLVNLAKKSNSRLVHISTDHVFSDETGAPFAEDSEVSPEGVYAVTKYLGEEIIKHSGLENYLIIRTSFMDSFLFERAFIDKFFSALRSDQIAQYVYAVSQWWDITGILNIGSRESRSVYNLAMEFNKDVKPMYLADNLYNKAGLRYLKDTTLDTTKWMILKETRYGPDTYGPEYGPDV